MKNDRIKFFVIVLIIFFASSNFGIIFYNYQIPITTQKNLKKPSDKSIIDEVNIYREPIELDPPKTADISQEQQEHNFSMSIDVDDVWNKSWHYENYNSTKNIPQTDIMIQSGTNGYNVTYYLYISDLTNKTSGQLISPNDLTTMNLWIYNGTPQGWIGLGQINDMGLGKGFKTGFLHMNETIPGYFGIFNTWIENVNITYNATMIFQFISNRILVTKFNPTVENTQSDQIKWELNFQKSSLQYYNLNYHIILYLNEEFTLSRSLGKDDQYWIPVETIRTPTEIILNETYNQYLVEVTSLNYVSIVYNNNLSFNYPTYYNNNNELQLSATCKMAGNLTIRFRLTNGEIIYYTKLVNKDEVVPFNYAMLLNDTGGIATLNVTLTDNSQSKFGVKICEVTFYKNTFLFGLTSNTTAFSQFFVIMAYQDVDLAHYYYDLNNTGKMKIYGFEMLNLTVIPNASLTYELGEFQGELDYRLLGRWPEAPNATLYWDLLDLSEYQIVPGEYHIIYRANKPGYQTLVFNDTIIISQKEVYIEVVSIDDSIAIEEDFIIVLNLYDSETMQNFLMTPVILNLTFTNNDTGEVAVDVQWPLPVIQSITIQDTMGNDTLPGTYNLTITIDSEYYYGTTSWFLRVEKKELDLSIDYDSIIAIGENTNISWSLENGNFTGNRVNMTLEILINGESYSNVSLTSNSTGFIYRTFNGGTYTITFRIISPFYLAEETITITSQAALLPPPDNGNNNDNKKEEENTLFILIILAILIGLSILAIFTLISRHKIKAKRELESELISLKTKASATEQNISLIETQISQIASIYWILVIHSEQGVTMIEIVDFKFEEVIGEEQKQLIGKGTIRDSALIGGFLTAIRNFSRETSGTSLEYQPVFNSQTDYSTVVDDEEIHRRILEGTKYFMAFVSSRGTIEISDVLSSVNSIFQDGYGEAVEKFDGAISPFRPFEEEAVNYLHNEIINLQKKLSEERLLFERFERHLKEVQEKIGIKPKKLK